MKSNLKGLFFGEIVVEMCDGNMWRLVQNEENTFGMQVVDVGRIVPPDGFAVDFASIPAPIRWAYPKTGCGPHGQYGPAAVIHDYLYSFHKIGDTDISQKLADRIFLLGMEIKDVRFTMRNLFYMAVRAGGWRYFGKPDKLNRLRAK